MLTLQFRQTYYACLQFLAIVCDIKACNTILSTKLIINRLPVMETISTHQ
jgi:hypothetical protein